jgi:hypothetical protein
VPYDEKLIQTTILIWEPHFGRPISAPEAEEMLDNAVGFFSLLLEWEKKANG